MLLPLLILIPLLSGLITFAMTPKLATVTSFIGTILTLVVAVILYNYYTALPLTSTISYDHDWLPSLGARFSLQISSGVSLLMILLTAISFPLILANQFNKSVIQSNTFLGLILLAQSGLMGVFLSNDALLFYLFWELALIPVYFLSSMYGGEKRIAVTFKFFVYTFVGSLLMLVALLYIYSNTPAKSFDWLAFVSVANGFNIETQTWLFACLFIAFAIKMPIFPFHTWQPDAYEQSATPVTIIMSALMVKMGLFAVLRWLLPIVPDASLKYMNLVIMLSVIGIVYASCMALVQTNIKRLIAYSSIAHVGLMCAALFSFEMLGAQGAGIQMFNHGINILGMWVIVSILENKLGTQDLRKMGGIAKLAPWFMIFLLLISLANIALPLTNGFVGEFIMFNGLFTAHSKYAMVFTIVAGIGVILAAVYTLRMIQQIAYGELKSETENFSDITWNEGLVLSIISVIIILLGVYPDLISRLLVIEKI